MKFVWVVTAFGYTEYRLVRLFSTKEKAKEFKESIKDLLWKRITIEYMYIDEVS